MKLFVLPARNGKTVADILYRAADSKKLSRLGNCPTATAQKESGDPMSEHNEADLQKLYDFIAGRGEWGIYGGGIWTNPGGNVARDKATRLTHDACLELEKRGLIKLKTQEPGLCVWEAVPSGKGI